MLGSEVFASSFANQHTALSSSPINVSEAKSFQTEFQSASLLEADDHPLVQILKVGASTILFKLVLRRKSFEFIMKRTDKVVDVVEEIWAIE